MLRSERQHTLGFGDCASRWVGGEVNLYEQENLPKHSESGSIGFELAVHTCRFVQPTDSSVIAQISHPGGRERLKLGCRLERRFQPLAEAACKNRAIW